MIILITSLKEQTVLTMTEKESLALVRQLTFERKLSKHKAKAEALEASKG